MSVTSEEIKKKANESLGTNVCLYDAAGNPILSSSGMPVAPVIDWDDIAFSYSGGNLSQIVFNAGGSPLRTFDFSYTNGSLTAITKS